MPTSPAVSRKKSIIITAVSSIVEWYDFTLYLYLTPTIAKTFFAESNTSSILITLFIFAASYLARPLGALIFGILGDYLGRRYSLLLSMTLIMIASFAMAILPSYAAVGSLAPILLLIVRLGMSISVGGEYTGITTYLLEVSSQRNHSLAASFAASCSELGGFLAAGIVSLLHYMGSAEIPFFSNWRWTFIFGGLLGLVVLILRATIIETFATHPKTNLTKDIDYLANIKSKIKAAFFLHKNAILVTFAISTIGSLTYYVGVTYIPIFLNNTNQINADRSNGLMFIPAIIVALASPVAGWAADKWGRKIVVITVGTAVLLTTIPAFILLLANNICLILLGAILLAILAGLASGVGAAAIPEQFPKENRLTSQALGAALATALVGGISPLIAEYLISKTHNSFSPAYYMLVLTGIAVLIIMQKMREVPTTK